MSKTLLLVEDSFTIQQVVNSSFTAAGYQVVVANDARTGLETLTRVSPDVILADATMPEMDGFQLCQAIRVTEGFELVPIVLLTSRFMSYDEDLAKRVGVTAYLAKPFDSFTLLSLVQQLLSGRPPAALFTEPAAQSAEPVAAEAPPPLAALASDSQGEASQAPAATVAAAEPAAVDQIYQTLSTSLLHIVQETVQTHLVTLLDALTPHLVEEVRSTVQAKLPEVLEVLLQQEIDKLKRAAAHEEAAAAPALPSDSSAD
jgi:CheY-like chemotaxis protein